MSLCSAYSLEAGKPLVDPVRRIRLDVAGMLPAPVDVITSVPVDPLTEKGTMVSVIGTLELLDE